jgi:hypothetical protein
MSVINEQVLSDLEFLKEKMKFSDSSIIVVENGSIILEKKGNGVKPLLETIDELKEGLYGKIIGDRVLGKASAMLCRYAKVKSVYSPQGTKTGLAVLIVGGVPAQVDRLIPFVKNMAGDDVCPFEKMLGNIDSPEEAFKILNSRIK